MTDKELDGLIREAFVYQAALQAAAARADPTPLPELPPAYLRWREKFLADPFRRARRAARPRWRRALNTAAAVLLVLAVSFGAVLTVSPEARAWVQRVVLHWFDDHAAFQFVEEDAAPDELGRWYPTWLPEGYELESEFAPDGYYARLYFENNEGLFLLIRYALPDGSDLSIDNEFHTLSMTEVNGYPAYLLTAIDERSGNSVTWLDEEENVAFQVGGYVEPDDLIRVAESLERKSE